MTFTERILEEELISKLFAVEYAPGDDVVNKALQRGRRQAVLRREIEHLTRGLSGLELLIAGANSWLLKALASFETHDVFGDVIAFVNELRVGHDQADQLFAAPHHLWRRSSFASSEVSTPSTR